MRCLYFALFLCLCFLSSIAHTNEELSSSTLDYTRTLKELEAKVDGDRVLFWIKLSDDSLWQWSSDIYSQHLLRKWQIGDQIYLRNTNQSGFLLQNCSDPRFMPLVAPVLQTPSPLITLVGIADEGNTLSLSDGSTWALALNFQRSITGNWQVGDFIFPVKCVHDGYELINIDSPYDDNIPYSMRPPNQRHVNAFLKDASTTLLVAKEEPLVEPAVPPQAPPVQDVKEVAKEVVSVESRLFREAIADLKRQKQGLSP